MIADTTFVADFLRERAAGQAGAAGFALYYREPLVSRDSDFDRVPGLRRVAY